MAPFTTWDGVLTLEQCAYLIAKYLPSKGETQGIHHDPRCADEVWAMVRANRPDLPQARPTGDVTLTAAHKGVGWHQDSPSYGGTHKLHVFLNAVPDGGTLFGERASPTLVENQPGRGVLFGFEVFHASQTFSPEHRKCAIGLRLTIDDRRSA